MANTFTQLYVHVVLVVKGRANLILPALKTPLDKYITGIITQKKQKLMVINGMPDHIHLLIGLKPDCALSDLVREIKSNSSKWVNDNNLVAGRFEWQSGFAAFSVSQSGVNSVIKYILTQEEHHQKITLKEEYISFLEAYQIEFNPEYLPDY